jgi:hypothetical protein
MNDLPDSSSRSFVASSAPRRGFIDRCSVRWCGQTRRRPPCIRSRRDALSITGVAVPDWGRERGAAALGIDKQASTSGKLPRHAEDVRVHRAHRERPLRLMRLEHHVVAPVAGLGVSSIFHRRWCPLNAGGLEAKASLRTTASFATPGGPTRSSASLRRLTSLRDRRSTDPWTDEGRTRNRNWQLTPICVASTTPTTTAPRSIVFEPRWQLPC